MLEVTVKVWGIRGVSPGEEKERLQLEGFHFISFIEYAQCPAHGYEYTMNI